MAPVGEGNDELLRCYRPRLVYDPQGDYRALAVDSIVDNRGNRLVRDGRVLAEAEGTNGTRLSLDLLAEYDAEKGDNLVEAPFRAAAARRLQGSSRYANVIYGRAPVLDRDMLWLQYWIWLYYRPARLLGTGRHEGDWRMFQVGLDRASHEPQTITVTQVGEGGRSYDWSQVHISECEARCGERCAHAHAKIGLASHAVRLREAGGEEDGSASLEALPTLESFGAWHLWPGRWGGTDAIGGFGRSPRSPAHQGMIWDKPATFSRKARSGFESKSRWRRALSKFFAPAEPGIGRGTWAPGRAVVDLSVSSSRMRWRQLVFVTVHRADDERVIRKRVASLGVGETRLVIPLPGSHPQHLFVRASTFNTIRQRSKVVTSDLLERDESAVEADGEWDEKVSSRFRHELVYHLTRHGAATAEELEARRFNVLDLALNHDEIVAVLESARRHCMIEPLNQSARADGTAVEGQEWVPTEHGRLRSRRLTEVAPKALTALPWALVSALVAVFGKKFDWIANWAIVVLVVSSFVLLATTAGFFVLRRSQGALPGAVARAWDRHAVELPELNRWYGRRYRFLPYALGVLLVIGSLAAVTFGTGSMGNALEGLVSTFSGAVIGGTAVFIVEDIRRTRALRQEAIAARNWRGGASA